jgi:Xaa-Pro aminopeptidase
MVKPVETTHKFGDKPWLGFEHVTMTPLCQKLIEPSLLSPSEKTWINDYHAEVWEKTKDYFNDDELTRNWLRRETTPI